MRPTTTYPSAQDFLPRVEDTGRGAGAALLAAVTLVLGSIRLGLAAAHDYQDMTGRGMPADTAAQRVFAQHFASAERSVS